MERVTYFAYNEGIEPDLLNIGSMAFDYANPRQRKPHRHKFQDLFGNPPTATTDVRPICALGENSAVNRVFGAGVAELFQFEYAHSKDSSRLILGQNGSKVELIDPDAFFQDSVLSNPKARLWLETRLSVASHFKTVYKNVVSSPTIWLLTGVYLIDDAKVLVVTSRSSNDSMSGKAPVPEPTGLATLLGISPGASISVGSSYTVQAYTQILGRKVWAAQWARVKARYCHVDMASATTQLDLNQLKLLDIFSTGTSRGESMANDIVELNLDAANAEKGDNAKGGEAYDEKLWVEFEERVEELVDDLGDETDEAQRTT